MSIRQSPVLAIACVLVTLSGYGCDDNGEKEPRVGRLSPSPISFNGVGQPTTNSIDYYAHGVTLQPAVVIPQLVPSAACPTRPPFLAPIRVVATGEADSDQFLSEVRMQFVDRSGGFGESMTLAGSQLVELFGSARIPRLGTRSFPFTFPFGCTGERTGTLTVFVFTGDPAGRKRSNSFSVAVR
jgi:hypothetical protein